MRFAIALATLIVFALAPPARADPVDDIITGQMERSHIPGAAVAVVEDGRVVKVAGYGQANLEWPSPVDGDTRFQLASATKLFTGVALMRLVEQGKLNLSDPLTKFYPDAPAAWATITVGHLASHTSGLAEDFGPNRPKTIADLVAAAKAAPLIYTPGSQAQYGFTDFVVLTDVLQRVSGNSLPELFNDEVFRPAGMTRTAFNFARDRGPIRASEPLTGRAVIYAWKEGRQSVSDFLYPELGYSAGGLYSTARDMAAFFAALDSGKLIRPESIAVLETATRLNDGGASGFGVAWTVGVYRGQAIVGHSGGPALADVIRVKGRKLTVIVLTNQQMFMPMLAEAVVGRYLPAVEQPPALADSKPAVTAAVRAVLEEAAKGRVDAAHFTANGVQRAVPFYADFGQAFVGGLGRLERLEVLADGEADGFVRRKYRAVYEFRTIYLGARATIDGKIEVLQPVGEND